MRLLVAVAATVAVFCVGQSIAKADGSKDDYNATANAALVAVLAHFRDHNVLTQEQFEHGVANGKSIADGNVQSLRDREKLSSPGFGIKERDPLYKGVEDKADVLIGAADAHIVFSLAGNNSGFFNEVQVALKSVVLNAPPRSPLFIHMICDSEAYDALDRVYAESGLEGTNWETQITIIRYNVKSLMDMWWKQISSVGLGVNRAHTVGTYFRLFAHEVLPPTVKTVVYMDPDAMFLVNVQEVMRHAVPHVIYQWGASQCAGFVLFNLHRMDAFWIKLKIAVAKLKEDLDTQTFNKQMQHGDQSMMKVVQQYFPEDVGPLPDAWDLSVANELWKVTNQIVEKRPRAGMLHFNGGGSSKGSYFEEQKTTLLARVGYRTANYYVELPWSWARFAGESRCAASRTCRTLSLVHQGVVEKLLQSP
jgi:hypothetical protein